MGRYEKSSPEPFIKTNEFYDFLNNKLIFILPLFAVFYVGMSELWGWPEADRVSGSIALATALLKGILLVNRKLWQDSPATGDGDLVINETDPEKPVWRMEWKTPLAAIPNKKTVTFKIVDESDPDELDRQILSQ